ncbi:MAG: hypothetical protein B6241_07360 [Spirochaetaceae bacterium 4572_59]|nr:MAG: hypothetical protein B6241_07360 [Spirochaetaceae bacterium 4572_59]
MVVVVKPIRPQNKATERGDDRSFFYMAAVITNTIKRPCDICARFGGEEFSIILPHTDLKGAYLVAEKIRQKVADLAVHYKGKVLKTTISCGIASSRGKRQ